MATMLAPVDEREVVRCDYCTLVQFRTHNSLCRRCHKPLDREELPVIAYKPEPVPVPAPGNDDFHIAATIRLLRREREISQRQLAIRMNVPRTYVSKIENEKATPTLSSLDRLAKALEISVCELLNGGRRRDCSATDLERDEFIAELIPYLQKLNAVQWQSVLTQMRDMTQRSRRVA